MEGQEMLTPREMAAELKKKAAEIERLTAENVKLERLAQDAGSYMNAFQVKLNEMRADLSKIESRTVDPGVIRARLELVQAEMDALKKTIDLYPWTQKTVDMIEGATRRISETAGNIAESARQNVHDFEEEIAKAERHLDEVLPTHARKKQPPGGSEPKKD